MLWETELNEVFQAGSRPPLTWWLQFFSCSPVYHWPSELQAHIARSCWTLSSTHISKSFSLGLLSIYLSSSLCLALLNMVFVGPLLKHVKFHLDGVLSLSKLGEDAFHSYPLPVWTVSYSIPIQNSEGLNLPLDLRHWLSLFGCRHPANSSSIK